MQKLKHKLVTFNKNAVVTLPVEFNSPYLVLGFICPELTELDEKIFSSTNLQPYELVCNRFYSRDFEIDAKGISEPGIRNILSLDYISARTFNLDNICVFVIAYLEFDQQ